MENEEMPPHVQRMQEECDELLTRTAALDVFIDGPTFRNLPIDERVDMKEQSRFMKCYAIVLGRRLVRAGGV